MTIRNTFDGTGANVTKGNQLQTHSESLPQQHYISHNFGRTFQAFGHSGTLEAGIITCLHVKNDDPDRDMVVTFFRAQIIGASGGSFDALTDYLEFGFGRTVDSGGTAMIPANMNRSSGVAASVTATENAPTMAGTFVPIGDLWHPAASGETALYNKNGSVILGLNDTLEIRYVGTHTAGEIHCRITFMMVDKL